MITTQNIGNALAWVIPALFLLIISNSLLDDAQSIRNRDGRDSYNTTLFVAAVAGMAVAIGMMVYGLHFITR